MCICDIVGRIGCNVSGATERVGEQWSVAQSIAKRCTSEPLQHGAKERMGTWRKSKEGNAKAGPMHTSNLAGALTKTHGRTHGRTHSRAFTTLASAHTQHNSTQHL